MLALLLLVACNLEVHADAFDRSCTIDDDCVLVDEGNVCGQCTTPAAVNVDAEQDFLDTVSARTRGCTIITTKDCPGDADGAPAYVARCDVDTCVAAPAD